MVTIPDSERRTRYTPSVSTTTFAIGFPIVEAGDIVLWLDGALVDDGDYSVTLGELVAGFYSSANVVFTDGITGTLDIVGQRPPHRTDQYTEGADIPASLLNREGNREALERREAYDRATRALVTAFGETINPLLPAAVAGRVLQVTAGGTGFEWVEAGAQGPAGPTGPTGPAGPEGPAGAGTGDVIGPGTVVDGHAVLFDGTTGTAIKSAGAAPALTTDIANMLESTDVGVSVQAFFALLQAMGTLGITADKLIYGTGTNTVALADITSSARTLLSKASGSEMRAHVSAAAKSQTAEALPIVIALPEDGTVEYIWPYMPFAGTLTALRRICATGSCTIQLRKNGANWGSAYGVTTSLQAATGLSLTWSVGDYIGYTISSNAAAEMVAVMGTATRALA